ncbi:MAG TPA: nicotinate phosphoribosyltransferase [Actinomycetota bacterium]|nr:nicotinate phosphoribosyltransferase [Actinomycetota bacterium]
MGAGLLTDLYELNMAASYLRRGMTQPATFSLFIRELPERWGFFVACGLESALDHLEGLRFEDEDIEYLREMQRYEEGTLAAFRGLRFTGEVRAIPEGTIVYPGEPLLEVTAPLPEAQLVETILLNRITFQTAICSKAARCRIVAPDKDLVDFAFRRVHGIEAAHAVARATAIAGFSATSNVEAARLLGLRAAGTMAHSYIESFGSEEEAFRAYAEDHPDRVVFLVDTYDTIKGVENAIEVARDLRGKGREVAGIRLDSGDLGELARRSREMLDEAGLKDVRIFASGAIDEHVLESLRDAPIDAFGVGSKIGVSLDAPTLDSVYKLVEVEGRPVAKLSPRKATLPGRKQVWRGPDGDLLGLAEEPDPEGTRPLLEEVMRGGKRLTAEGMEAARERFNLEVEALPDRLRSLDAAPTTPTLTPRLRALNEEVQRDIRARELG